MDREIYYIISYRPRERDYEALPRRGTYDKFTYKVKRDPSVDPVVPPEEAPHFAGGIYGRTNGLAARCLRLRVNAYVPVILVRPDPVTKKVQYLWMS